jgi:hypothetical protein
VFEQSKGPLLRVVNGSKSPWISPILASTRPIPSSALAAGPSAGTVFFISDASSRATLAMAGEPVSVERRRLDERRLEARLERVEERVARALPLVVLALVEAHELAEALRGARVHVARAELVHGLRVPSSSSARARIIPATT